MQSMVCESMTTMNSGLKWRVGGFSLAIALLALLEVWAAFTAWRRVDESGRLLASVEVVSLHIGSTFQASLLGLNEVVFKYASHHDQKDWTKFEEDWKTLDHWIDQQIEGHRQASRQEKQILDELNAAYDDYRAAAEQIGARAQASADAEPNVLDFANFEQQSARLLNLADKLAEAHRETLVASVTGSNLSLAYLRALLLGSLFLLLAFGGWLAIVVYQQLIAPLQVQLVESKAMLERQEKLASLGVLAAGVAHEIRNPLTAIKAWLFMHQRRLRPDTQEHADARIIANELERLERIVKDFLLFARPSDPKLEIVVAEQPLRAVRELLAPQLEKSGIQIRLEESRPAWIRIDAHQIKQVLINLVQNAADAIGQNGVVTLRALTDRKRLAERDIDVVILSVTDTGKGIPPEAQKRLFDPFFTTKESGTGLGLPIAARIVEKHGGALQYQTQVNRGTTFGIVLPRVQHHENQNSAD